MKRILGLAILMSVAIATTAQDDSKKGKPDVPGTLLIDFGFNFLQNAPSIMDTKFFGSKTFNLYYQYDIPLGDSKFSVHPGIGVGIDKYSFDQPVGIFNSNEEIITPTVIDGQTVDVVTYNHFVSVEPLGDRFPTSTDFAKSKLTATYIDIPLEFRFHTNPYDKSRSFKVGLGGRIGLRVNSHMKVKYTEDGETVKYKNHHNFDMNTIRYGAMARIGIGWFNLFYYHNFSDLFKSGKGPARTTSISNYTIGLTIAGF